MEIDRNQIERFSFHESTLERVYFEDTRLTLRLSGVKFDGKNSCADLRLSGLGRICCDGIAIQKFEMRYPDAEVLSLEFGDDAIKLVLEWNDFSSRSSETNCYAICFDDLIIDVS